MLEEYKFKDNKGNLVRLCLRIIKEKKKAGDVA